ncbi:MAG: DUF1256 domain-containing protein [bacterium]
MNKPVFNNNYHFQYINSNSNFAITDFNNSFFEVLSKYTSYYDNLIILCIGSERTLNNSIAPLVGYKLSNLSLHKKIFIYGSLEHNVTSKNLISCVNMIYSKHKNPLLITIDSSSTKENLVNHINIGEGSIKLNCNANCPYPYIGDIFITALTSNNFNLPNLSNPKSTKLFNIIRMSDIITSGIWHCTNNIL